MNIKLKELILGSILLTGCGGAVSADPPGQPGVFADITINAMLEKHFDDVKQCTKLEKGKFSEVSVVLVAPSQIVVNGKSVLGDFVAPNILNIEAMKVDGDPITTFRHEVIHYLMNLNTGDPDSNHTSKFFYTCVSW
jgi:hypothetical protein